MKQVSMLTRIFLFSILIFAAQFSSCKKDDDDAPITASGPTLKTTVTGRVTDTDDNVVIGVTVVLGTKTTVTDSRGYFLFENTFVPKDRLVIKGSKQGFFDCIKGKKTQTGGVNYINLVMEELPASVDISGTVGGVVNIPGGANITFPANAFTDANGNAYTGTVKIYARHFNPAAPGFEAVVPGGDLIGINAAGQPQSLYSLGMIEALLKDNSGVNEIKLATGITAQLRFPIDPSQTSEAQATIPLWYLNETTGIWKEEGQAIKNGNFFEGNVSHFSTWNCDYQGERTDIVGKVVDCQGVPMANIVVTINGFMNVATDNAGNYSAWVPAGWIISFQVLAIYNPFIASNSSVQTVSTVGGQLNIVNDIMIPCSTKVIGVVKKCGSGLNSPASIYASWIGGERFQFSLDGNYEIFLPLSTTIYLTASNYTMFDTTSIVTGGLNTTIIADELSLCVEGGFVPTLLTLNQGNGASSQNYVVNPNSAIATFEDWDGDGLIEGLSITIEGTASPNNEIFLMEIYLNDVSDNLFDLSDVSSSIYIEVDGYSVTSGGPILTNLNRLIITDSGHPGGIISGQFEFDSSPGVSVTNGSFSALRAN